jgi:hypothetical protein
MMVSGEPVKSGLESNLLTVGIYHSFGSTCVHSRFLSYLLTINHQAQAQASRRLNLSEVFRWIR